MIANTVLGLLILMSFYANPAVSHFAAPATLEFDAPTFDSPFYSISGKFGVEDTAMVFKSLTLNGAKAEHLLVMKEGKPADLTKALAPGLYEILIRYAWQAKKPYKVSVLYQTGNSPKEPVIEWVGTAPDRGGVASPAGEGFFRAFKIAEEAGLARQGETIVLTLTAPKNEIEKSDFFFFDGGASVPYQLLEVKESVPPESQAKTHPVTLTYKIALQIDAEPYQKKVLLALKGGGRASEEKGFEVSGEGLGKTVKSSRLALGLSPKSGQINTIEYLKEGIKLHNEKAGVIHWNPDVFIPGIAWDHSFDWNPPQSFAERDGAFVYDASGDFSHKAGTYFYAPSDGEYVYWVRPYLYTWADYMTSNHLTFLPQGSFFYEKNAYVLLPWDDKTVETLEKLARKLKSPLRVF